MDVEVNHVGPCTRSKRKAQTAHPAAPNKKANTNETISKEGVRKRRKINPPENKKPPQPVVVLSKIDANSNDIIKKKLSKSLSSSDEDFEEIQPIKIKTRNLKMRNQTKTIQKSNKVKPDGKTININDKSSLSKPSVSTSKMRKDAESSESESEWEDVTDREDDIDDEHDGIKKEKEPHVNKDGVEITLEVPETIGSRRRKKKEFDVQDYFRLRVNRYKKEVQLNMHKVHLLCLLSRGIFISNIIADDEIKATVFSIIPPKHLAAKCNQNKKYLTKVLAWFPKLFTIDNNQTIKEGKMVKDAILNQISEKAAHNKENLCAILAIILRLVGFECRLIFSFQPVPLKPSDLKPKQPRDDKGLVAKKPKKSSSKSPKSKRSNAQKLVSTDSDSDFSEPRVKSKGSVGGQKKPAPDSVTEGDDVWLEVYFGEKEGWVSVNPFTCAMDSVQEMERRATQPLKYVLAFNVDGHVRDVTVKYASEWLSTTRKLRVDSNWWKETLELQLLKGHQTERDDIEDKKIQQGLEDAPVPTTISQIKNHPLYILQRHLLKFQGIYPSESVPVAFIRGEAVYSRHCVHTLHSRETWLKDARTVRIGETPYKVVKARPKWNKNLQALETDLPLELFGQWQTEEYVPPPVKDGKIPRNEFGNVELFKPCMLPPGSVHVQDTPGLNKVARQLGVDCAAAMVGWDYHAGGSHPLFDGWVICEEHKDMLLDAWREDQEIMLERRKEKREKEIYSNWRRLIRGLLIRERLRIQHGSECSSKSTT